MHLPMAAQECPSQWVTVLQHLEYISVEHSGDALQDTCLAIVFRMFPAQYLHRQVRMVVNDRFRLEFPPSVCSSGHMVTLIFW